MPRYKLLIEYDGTDTRGWQRQASEFGPSIQGLLEAAIERFCGHPVTVNGAGRTDAGVHALGQVAHVDLARPIPAGTIRDAGNVHLRPHPVTIVSAEAVDETFDARFSATARHYLYRLTDRRAPPTLDRHLVWHVPKPLDVAAMQEAATGILGRHDFTTFRSADCQAKSAIRTLDRLDVERVGSEIRVFASARSFLHNQVRSMVGSLRKVGDGSWSPADLRRALDAADRKACGPVAPPHGLCLIRVDYKA